MGGQLQQNVQQMYRNCSIVCIYCAFIKHSVVLKTRNLLKLYSESFKHRIEKLENEVELANCKLNEINVY